MRRSLRSQLIVASLLWTGGLLALMHMASLVLLHAFPRFRGAGALFPILFGVSLMAAGLAVARRGLAPFHSLSAQLVSVRKGRQRSVGGEYPAEVAPLIDELNALLEDRERAVQRALATAGDLAHGLKTPLALLARDAGRAGDSELGASIAQQVERMSRQVDYHLARARAAVSGASGAAPCAIAPCAEALIRAVSKLHEERRIRIESSVDAGVRVRVRLEDLDEILGNLLDNACKWASSKVTVSAEAEAETVALVVDDDGPGLAPHLRAAVLERGVRADEVAPGSGLGLAIVRDLAEIYGGSVALGESPAGGLRARVVLPRAIA